jgi:hypothetical protein
MTVRKRIVSRGRSSRMAWFAPISPAGGITQYGWLGGLSRSDPCALTLSTQNQAHLDRTRHAASTRQTGWESSEISWSSGGT